MELPDLPVANFWAFSQRGKQQQNEQTTATSASGGREAAGGEGGQGERRNGDRRSERPELTGINQLSPQQDKDRETGRV